MSSQIAMSVMGASEVVFWALLGILFWRKKLQHRFRALSSYIVLRVATAPVFALLLYGQAHGRFSDLCYSYYFYA